MNRGKYWFGILIGVFVGILVLNKEGSTGSVYLLTIPVHHLADILCSLRHIHYGESISWFLYILISLMPIMVSVAYRKMHERKHIILNVLFSLFLFYALYRLIYASHGDMKFYIGRTKQHRWDEFSISAITINFLLLNVYLLYAKQRNNRLFIAKLIEFFAGIYAITVGFLSIQTFGVFGGTFNDALGRLLSLIVDVMLGGMILSIVPVLVELTVLSGDAWKQGHTHALLDEGVSRSQKTLLFACIAPLIANVFKFMTGSNGGFFAFRYSIPFMEMVFSLSIYLSLSAIRGITNQTDA